MSGSDHARAGEPVTPRSEETQRAVPYHCPFCAEEDLRPVEAGAVAGLARGGWHCRSCLRVFSLAFHGIHSASTFAAVPSFSGSDRS
jgi:ribosomal protein L37AE/L43A